MNAEQLLMYLENIANENLWINFGNHIIIFLSIILCFTKIRHKKEIIFGSISLLFLSVLGNAVYYGNPFHLITFLVMMIFLIAAYFRNSEIDGAARRNIAVVISLIFVLLGIWYPEFTHVNKGLALLFSPLGIVPCPTLLTAGGIINIFAGKINKKFFICILIFMIIYGLIGTFVLKVYYDISLLVLAIFSLINLRKRI